MRNRQYKSNTKKTKKRFKAGAVKVHKKNKIDNKFMRGGICL